MIPALAEGLTQSVLPCSWTFLLPAVAVGLGARRTWPVAGFVATAVVAAWILVAGWFAGPLWLAGIFLLAGGVSWWRRGLGVGEAAALGAGSAWAWRPCVGPALGEVLNAASSDPFGILAGLGAFLVGVLAVGLGLGLLARRLVVRPVAVGRLGAVVVGLLGLAFLVGLYPRIASTLASWSTFFWA